ncbi:MAG: ABC transporter ATP-binding protein [Candidatus Aenigmatarchaeota archaeon]
MEAIEVKGLYKTFREEKTFSLKNINLEVGFGEFFALLGPNGSGKTTLINIILTILIPDKGKVRILGRNPFKDKDILQLINYVPVEKPSSHLKVKSFLNCYAGLYGIEQQKIEKVLDLLKISYLKEREMWKLSTGELSKIALAKALLNEPEVLILDEPTFGLDPKTKREIHTLLQKLNRSGTTIFFASHDMVEVERLANKIAFIKDGKILEIEEKSELLKKYKTLENYWLRLGK